MKTLLAFIVGFGSYFIYLFVAIQIWALTVVPMGAPPLTLKSAYGVSLVLGSFMISTLVNCQPREKDGDILTETLTKSITGVIVSLIGWLIAYLVF